MTGAQPRPQNLEFREAEALEGDLGLCDWKGTCLALALSCGSRVAAGMLPDGDGDGGSGAKEKLKWKAGEGGSADVCSKSRGKFRKN